MKIIGIRVLKAIKIFELTCLAVTQKYTDIKKYILQQNKIIAAFPMILMTELFIKKSLPSMQSVICHIVSVLIHLKSVQ